MGSSNSSSSAQSGRLSRRSVHLCIRWGGLNYFAILDIVVLLFRMEDCCFCAAGTLILLRVADAR